MVEEGVSSMELFLKKKNFFALFFPVYSGVYSRGTDVCFTATT